MNIDQFAARKLAGDRIVAFLKATAVGRDNARPRTEVMAHVCYNGPERPFRRIYRERGVASCDKGLYWAEARDVGAFGAYLVKAYGEDLAEKRLAVFFHARPELRRTATVPEAQPGLFEDRGAA